MAPSDVWLQPGTIAPGGRTILASTTIIQGDNTIILMGTTVVLMGKKIVLVGNKIILMGTRIILVGTKIILMGKKIVLVGTKIILMGKKIILMGKKIVLMGKKIVVDLLSDAQMLPATLPNRPWLAAEPDFNIRTCRRGLQARQTPPFRPPRRSPSPPFSSSPRPNLR